MSIAAVEPAGEVGRAQVPQAHQQRGACRKSQQHPEEAEQLTKRKQRKNDHHRMQADPLADDQRRDQHRSEEHTSELQSLAYLVCRLLLEKKKKTANSKSRKHKMGRSNVEVKSTQ